MKNHVALSALFLGVLIPLVSLAQQDPARFAEHVRKVIDGHFPERECRLQEDLNTLVCGDITLSLENLRRKIDEVGAEGADADRMILEFFSAGVGEIGERQHQGEEDETSGTSTWKALRERLRPQLVPKDYRRQHAGIITKEFVPEIDIAWVIDEPDRYVFVLASHLKDWKVSRQTLEQQALANLAAVSKPLEIKALVPEDSDLPGRWLAISEGDGYDAARYLVPAVRERISDLLGESFFVAFPNRDFLVAWSRDYAYHLGFAERVEKDFDTRHHPLSPRVYVGSKQDTREATVEDHMSAIRIDWGDD